MVVLFSRWRHAPGRLPGGDARGRAGGRALVRSEAMTNRRRSRSAWKEGLGLASSLSAVVPQAVA